MRFIFLGTGTSSGIPIIACRCDVCRSEDPRDTRLRSGAAVTWTDGSGNERVVFLDATPDLRQQVLLHDFWRCDAIFFTHHHVDHIFGLDEVRRFNAVMNSPIDIYAEPRVVQNLERVYKHIFDRPNNINDSFVASLITFRLHPAEPVELHGMRFTPIRLLHGKLPILGYRIEPIDEEPKPPFPLAYCTDVSGIPPESWSLLEGLDTLILDALRIRKHPTHFNLDQACNAAARIGARQTWFTHIAHEILHARIDPDLPEGMNLAYDGLVLGP